MILRLVRVNTSLKAKALGEMSVPEEWGWLVLITRAAMACDQVRNPGNGPSQSSPGSHRLIRFLCS